MCLGTDIKLYSLDAGGLRRQFNEISGLKVNNIAYFHRILYSAFIIIHFYSSNVSSHGEWKEPRTSLCPLKLKKTKHSK